MPFQPAQRRWSREQFLELLDDEDIAALRRRWELADDADFAAALDARSTTTLLRDVLALHTPTLRMLRDVFGFLSRHASPVRTTGSLLVLDEEFDIAPQQVTAVLDWSPKAMRRSDEVTWTELQRRLDDEIVPLFDKVEEYGSVDVRRRQEDVVHSYIRALSGGSSEIRRSVNVELDEDAFRVREEYVERLGQLAEKLAPISDRVATGVARRLLMNIEDLHDALRRRLDESRYDLRGADDVYNRTTSADGPTSADEEIWKRFAENVLFLADVEESVAGADLLRMDLFRKRPQLFEVWIVVTVLDELRRLGFRVELLGLGTSAAGRTLWNLNYAKSSKPIARCVRSGDAAECFLFYQLFRAGKARDDMPDLALLPTADPHDRPIWILDPKHSERRGYTRRDYEHVARRYHATFGPKRTWIVEFYPRPDLGTENPLTFEEGASLIRNVSPEGDGLPRLLAALHDVHSALPGLTMAVIDVSGSFHDQLPRVLDDLRACLDAGTSLADDVIWFADDATRGTGLLDVVMGRIPAPKRSGGTSFAPVLVLIEHLDREGGAPTSLRIYTDRGFSDIAVESALATLRKRGEAEIIDL